MGNVKREYRGLGILPWSTAGAVAALLLVGCAAEVGGDGEALAAPDGDTGESSEEEVLKQYLDYSGFEDTEGLTFDHDLGLVMTGDDVALMLDDVREQLYSQKGYDFFGVTANFNTPSGPVTPYTIKKISSSLRGDIGLKFETPQTHWWATEPVNDFWKAAFRNAAQQWSNAGSDIDISESNRGGNVGANISIMVTSRIFCDKDGDGDNDCIAMGAAPGFGHPGHYVLVNANATSGCAGGWAPPGCTGGACFARLIHVALHELGHTIGMAHTGCFNHIAGTSSDSTCNASAAYSTQMAPTINCNDNGLLKSDDINSIRRTY